MQEWVLGAQQKAYRNTAPWAARISLVALAKVSGVCVWCVVYQYSWLSIAKWYYTSLLWNNTL